MLVAKMALAQPITETLILYLQNGVSLDGASKNPAAVQTFIQLTSTLKAQKGFLGQLWVTGLSLASVDE
jgi:hypothetical protein